MRIWEKIEEKYVFGMKNTFHEFWEEREYLVDYFSKTQKEFISFLGRPDTKQMKVNEFVEMYNKFSDDYPDLREDP